jgi:hypothetical protein
MKKSPENIRDSLVSSGVKDVKTSESLAPILTVKFERIGLPDAGLSSTCYQAKKRFDSDRDGTRRALSAICRFDKR